MAERWVVQFCHCHYGPFLDVARQYAALFAGGPYKVLTVYLTGKPSDKARLESASDEVVFLDIPPGTYYVTVDPDIISVSFNGQAVCRNGYGVDGARDVDLSGEDIDVIVDLGLGDATASVRTTDLSHAYVEENSAYSS